MPYGFAQRVVNADAASVLRAARKRARETGLSTGVTHRFPGVLGERVMPITDGRTTGRLWVWDLAPGLSYAYLGLEDASLGAKLSTAAVRRRLNRAALRLVDALGRSPSDSMSGRLGLAA
jgi:hypothetical protein